MEKLKLLTPIFLFVLVLSILSIQLNKPFFGEHDWNGARNGNIARNYLKYGLLTTKLGQVENSGIANPRDFSYYTHYPPLLSLLISTSYFQFGVTEYSTKIIPLLATTGTVILIFLIGQLLFSYQIGLVASLLSLSTPMVIYFGKNPSQEPLVVFFILLSTWGYLHKNFVKWLFPIGLILAEATTWTGFFFIPALTIVSILQKDFKEVKRLLIFWLISALVFTSYLIFLWVTSGNPFAGGLINTFFQRSGISEAGKIENLNIISYLDRLRVWYFTLFTTSLTLLSIFWIIYKLVQRKISKSEWIIVTLGLWGIIYSLIFINASFIHNYLIFYLLPFIALSASLIVKKTLSYIPINSWLIIPILIALVFGERFNFIQALYRSDGDRFAVELGKYINTHTKPSDLVKIKSSPNFWYRSENFLKFYGDRQLVSPDSTQETNITIVVDESKQQFEITN